MTDPPSHLWVNGRIHTGRRIVEALYLEGGNVRGAGTAAEIRGDRAAGTEVTDLHGRFVVPGLIDAHLHLRGSVLARGGVDLTGVRSAQELADRLAQGVARTPGGPVIGTGWDQEILAERRAPTKAELDKVSSTRPIVAFRVCSHVAVLNSPALDLAEVGDGPARDHGLLQESELLSVGRVMGAAFAARADGVAEFLNEAAAYGLTTIAPMGVDAAELDIVERAYPDAPTPVRVRAYLGAPDLEEAEAALRPRCDDDVRVVGIKSITDGSLGARTAWLEEAYSDAPGAGVPWGTSDDMVHTLERARELRLDTAWHAIGDRALRRVLEILTAHPGPGRVRIEHGSMTPPGLIGLLQKVRADLVVQPSFIRSDRWLSDRLGPERARSTYAYRTLLDAGLRLAGSSDSPVESLDAWTGMADAIAPRAQPSSRERLDPAEALGLYTRHGAEVLGEPSLGHLEVGASGDLVVVDAPDLESALRLGSGAVLATYRSGRATYERGRDEAPFRRRSR